MPDPEGDAATTSLSEITFMLVAALEPKWIALAPENPLPFTATRVPPTCVPELGLRPVTTGAVGLVYVKRSALERRLVPKGVVTVTSTLPSPFGDTAVIELAELTTKLAAGVLPKSIAVAPVNSEPEMLTLVPPADDPLGGLTEVTVGPLKGPTTKVVLATIGDPGAGFVPFPSKGVTLVSDTVRV